MDLNDRACYEEARAVLSDMARSTPEFAADDDQLQAMVEELKSMDPVYGRIMAMRLKKLHHMGA